MAWDEMSWDESDAWLTLTLTVTITTTGSSSTQHNTTHHISWDHLSRAGLGWAHTTPNRLSVCLFVYLSVYRLVSLSLGQCNGVSVYVGRWLEHQWYIFVCFVDMELKTHNLRKHHMYPLTHTHTDQQTDRRVIYCALGEPKLSWARLSWGKLVPEIWKIRHNRNRSNKISESLMYRIVSYGLE